MKITYKKIKATNNQLPYTKVYEGGFYVGFIINNDFEHIFFPEDEGHDSISAETMRGVKKLIEGKEKI